MNVTDKQFAVLTTFSVVVIVIGGSISTMKLLDVYGSRVLPLLLFIVTVAAIGIVVLLNILRHLS